MKTAICLRICVFCAIIPRVARLYGFSRAREGSVCFVKQFSYVLTKPNALHVRPVNHLMRETSRFSSSVRLAHGDQMVSLKDARLLMGAGSGSTIVVTVEGKDEEAAIAAVQNYFVANM